METAKEGRSKKKWVGVWGDEKVDIQRRSGAERAREEEERKEVEDGGLSFRFLFSEARHFSYPSPSFSEKREEDWWKRRRKGSLRRDEKCT